MNSPDKTSLDALQLESVYCLAKPMKIRPATSEDAPDIAYLTNLAGEGLPHYLWTNASHGDMPPLEYGADKARQENGSFSYKNIVIAEDEHGKVLGMMLGTPQPDPYERPDFNRLPPQVRPLIELEALAPGSYYINALGVYQQHQGQGAGSLLLRTAEEFARNQAITTMSLVVASENRNAKKLYQKLGYLCGEKLAVVDYPSILHAGDWVLMRKEL